MSVRFEPSSDVFDRWSQVYDDEPNALLRLEDRIAPQLLPDLTGKRVLDIGCGTGRWLQRMEAMNPGSVTGIDCSSAMLERAARKLSHLAVLRQSDCRTLPFADSSFDFILCSFALGYIVDLSSLASECARVLAPGGALLLSDMHPMTAMQHQWTHSFRLDGSTVEIAGHTRTLNAIGFAFADAGLRMKRLEEPAFDIAEREVFVQAGRLHVYESLRYTPAIYLMQLHKPARTLLANTRWSGGPSIWRAEPLILEDAQIATSFADGSAASTTLDLSGYVLLPGLINAHDHLEFALFPNLGRSSDPYNNATEWAHDIHERHADVITLHRRVPLRTRLWWGAIRNLLCGVTYVCHHNPLHTVLMDPAYPLRVLKSFGWAHSLAFDADLMQRFDRTPTDQPFILHAAEGIDASSQDEFIELERRHLLSERTVLVHGLALSAMDVASLNRSGAALIVCPSSNRFLFHRTMPAPIIEGVERVALGSDSPLTAQGDLLDEIRSLHREQSVTSSAIYNMVTTAPAGILRLQEGEGQIVPGGPADLIAVRDRQRTPAETLPHLSFVDIELVVVAGRVQVASQTMYDRLPHHLREGLEPLLVAGSLRYLRAPIDELLDSAEEHLGRNQLRLGQKEVRRVATL